MFHSALQVGMRIVGTTAGTSIAHGMLSNSVLAASPALLIVLMAAISLVLAPLASPSFHLRLTTALITISLCVTVVCQYDLTAQTANASVAFFATRVMEVRSQDGTGTCLSVLEQPLDQFCHLGDVCMMLQ